MASGSGDDDPVLSEGERWAADALTALRRRGFSPAATVGFLRDSLRRAGETRGQHPELASQARLWAGVGTTGALALREAAACAGRPVPGRESLLGWLVALALMLDWHLGMVEGIDGSTRERLSPADALTLSRATAAPFLAAAPPDRSWFVLLLGCAGTTDLLDGCLARRGNGPTRLGRDFDSLADAAFRIAASRGARRAGWIDAGAERALVARQMVFLAVALWHWFGRSERPPKYHRMAMRLHVPLLLAGLASGASGQPRVAGRLLRGAAVVGGIALVPVPMTRPQDRQA